MPEYYRGRLVNDRFLEVVLGGRMMENRQKKCERDG